MFRMSKRELYKQADINTDAIKVSYFPFPEYTWTICG